MTADSRTQTPPLATIDVNGKTVNGVNTNGIAHTDGAAASRKQTPLQTQPSGTSPEDSQPTKAKRRPRGGFDPTKLPDAPQGYTLRFTFHSAANLAPGDLSTAQSDPYLHATLKAPGLKRHKEDPDLTYRTRTLRRTLEPEWNESWTVANVPPTGFTLKCRLYDEDSPDKDDRLGNVTLRIPRLFADWEGIPPPGRTFEGKKRVMSKRAYVVKAVTEMFQSGTHMTPLVKISIELLGKSDPPHGHMYTIGPASWTQHFSPMIGRLAGVKVDDEKKKEGGEEEGKESQQTNGGESSSGGGGKGSKNQRYE